ncbi:MAG: pyruvate dehydrogenase (acetyl-transferring) E1 component subunit alpha, partial [Actinobacteria bacterium]|nr:pyruvate dehydrogenase (acetyl-transferring) E1 component subunit alpha [Actinomycetota bacterium]
MDKSLKISLLKGLYKIRFFEQRAKQLYQEGLMVGALHPYIGEEAIAVGACAAVNKNDYIFSTHRGHGHCIAKGADIKFMIAELMGKETGYCRGRGGS